MVGVGRRRWAAQKRPPFQIAPSASDLESAIYGRGKMARVHAVQAREEQTNVSVAFCMSALLMRKPLPMFIMDKLVL